jgi:glycosyltransferase involved in cell wall biosynthesis
MTTIAAIVVSLPERHELLVEALGSIRSQTRAPDDTLIGIDPRRYGEVNNFNRLIAATDCEWLAFLDDDDLWFPEHLAIAEKYMDDYDVIVGRYELVNRPWNTIEPWHENFDDLRWTNWIGSPSMVVARKSVFGEFQNPMGRFCWIDWCTYNSLLDKGARFVDTRTVTTQYRFMGNNGSWNP